MTTYFHELESVHSRFGDDDNTVLKVLADRYMGANPPSSFINRTFFKSGVLQTKDGLYDINLGERFPEAEFGQFGYAYALVWSDDERNLDLRLRCLGPVQFYFNEERTYRSNVIDEIKPDAEVKLNLNFCKGWNRLFIKAVNTPAGFGCQIGADEAKVRILNVLTPFKERAGQAGWVFSEPVDADVFEKGPAKEQLESEFSAGLTWLPQQQWNSEQAAQPALERLFGRQPGKQAYAWTQLHKTTIGTEYIVIEGNASGPITVWVDGHEVWSKQEAGSYQQEIELSYGKHDVLVRSVCTDEAWGFSLSTGAAGCHSVAPVAILGTESPWLYLGPFDKSVVLSYSDVVRTDRVYEGNYWRLDQPEAWVRPYYENAMLSNKWTVGSVTNYARWDYPLGVTIYGLLQTGRWLDRKDITDYAISHVQACTQMYEYSLWDQAQYGFPAINQQLVIMKMLDNCGSFGSAMLEAYQVCKDEGFLPIADRIADFMLNQLERKADGAFYRECEGEYSANTMWADDLYMSTPFLCRYYRVTGNTKALDETAKQFLLFRNYLFMPDQRIMSHVYDFKYNRPTGIPWGRGNGWTLFSLTEVLETLPDNHPKRGELISFFNELCEGYAELQAESGLWHQVLNDRDAYEEASCTAMFAYSFARGVRFSWLNEPDKFIRAATRAWDGLTRYAIDRKGNVHGVCSGSRYAFTAEYYKKDLLTVINDNHGIGIMMLAGSEVAKLKAALSVNKQ